jgi:hypothetical protein
MKPEVTMAAASAAIALAAFFLSWRADRRAAALARTRMFLARIFHKKGQTTSNSLIE